MAPREEEDASAPPANESDEGSASDDGAREQSLLEDIEAMIEDGKTYLETELNYQKARTVYVADRLRAAAFAGAVSAAFGFIALIGLTVGLIMALSPWLTPWGASALVVGVELVLGVVFARRASRNWGEIMAALGVDEGQDR